MWNSCWAIFIYFLVKQKSWNSLKCTCSSSIFLWFLVEARILMDKIHWKGKNVTIICRKFESICNSRKTWCTDVDIKVNFMGGQFCLSYSVVCKWIGSRLYSICKITFRWLSKLLLVMNLRSTANQLALE